MRRPSILRAVIIFCATATLACGDNPTTPTPTPDLTPVTESFEGTLTVNGAVTFAPIAIQTAGSVNASLRGLRPRLTMRVASGGSGTFVVGETVYIGENPDEPTGSATVHAWNPATNGLFLNDLSGTLPTGETIIGVTSGARWTNESLGNTIVGLALGTWSGTTCTIVLANDITAQGGLVSGVVQGAGSLCARVYDVGRLEGPATFTIDVTHF
ncbi:MAG: hypothetical protein ABS36_05825 [Acidobacteria bacterium SCN 69-37]|nr:MAG: hypothetical protein ABS36_05825 [Acidobacteria bacterium SCN 69-37]